MRVTALLAVAAACVVASCHDAPAGEPTPTWHYGVLEYTRVVEGTGERERYRWISADGDVSGEGPQAVWQELKVKADITGTMSDQIRIMEFLAAAGWELYDTGHLSFVLASATAVEYRYLFRRRA